MERSNKKKGLEISNLKKDYIIYSAQILSTTRSFDDSFDHLPSLVTYGKMMGLNTTDSYDIKDHRNDVLAWYNETERIPIDLYFDIYECKEGGEDINSTAFRELRDFFQRSDPAAKARREKRQELRKEIKVAKQELTSLNIESLNFQRDIDNDVLDQAKNSTSKSKVHEYNKKKAATDNLIVLKKKEIANLESSLKQVNSTAKVDVEKR